MPIGMSVTSTGVDCVFWTVTVSTPLSNRAVMTLMSALSGNCEQQRMTVSNGLTGQNDGKRCTAKHQSESLG